MVKTCRLIFFVAFLSYYHAVLSQEELINRGLSFKIQSSIHKTLYEDYPADRNPDFELARDSKLVQAKISSSYQFNNSIALGAALGWEQIEFQNQQLGYYPIGLNFVLFPFDRPGKGFSNNIQFGTHLGDLDHPGLFLSTQLEYHLPIFRYSSIFIQFGYSIRKFEKKFVGSQRPDGLYNIQAFGIGVGLDIFIHYPN